ncbi:Helix-loop-helix DNA binding protein [Cordyceps fumosorosea ARSEF 2679]|uniref:Helix-loop-helix DNA binding protein n=1 Tax=Cordyceps fumosorosea (strain ARSEF 2679) TaxID=1081104 RepID=A0A167RNA6_CORFA|nr:Helix-loop-helix DNA binding protein [Cordyceps fumosorosea ARSEF 2679]OAA58763.1 Helix-loop-helix DNA binding protein [Cordyceps fumosorosea ARSEF 2679]
MSDPLSDHPDLTALTASPTQKRKREVESPTQRHKRMAPAAAMTAETAAFIENAIEATNAAAANGVNVADFNALQQATHGDHTDHASSDATTTAQAALGMYPTLHVPPSTEEQFAAQAADSSEHQHDPNEFNAEITHDMMDQVAHQSQNGTPPQQGQQQQQQGQQQQRHYSTSSQGGSAKPPVGSDEWHKLRKDNHKEVERRRRETINEGINELAKIVPGCEKNKGSILQRAVSFISQLKENEQQNIEKWTLEKLLTEQAITELSQSNDKLKQECERLYRELETWKRVAQNAGLEPPQPKEEPSVTG